MIDFNYLHRGLCALSNAHRVGALAGHLGAAVVAGYFFGEDHHDLDETVHAGVERELDRIIRGEENLWYNAKKTGVSIPSLFEPLPKQDPQKELIASIPHALAENIKQTRQSGHNVIFASIAVRALRDHPEFATPQMVDGICKLVSSFNGAKPGRGYYGKQKGWMSGEKVELSSDTSLPPYQNKQVMVDRLIELLASTAAERRQGFGGLFHVINHAAGLLELATCGYMKLARQGLAAHQHHVRLYRSLPEVSAELGAPQRAEHDPWTPEYWAGTVLKRDSARLTHRIKTLYGFAVLMRLVPERGKRQEARNNLRYLMA